MEKHKSLLTYFIEAYDHYRTDHQADSSLETASKSTSRLRRLVRWFLPNGGTILLIIVLILTQRVWAKPLLAPAAAPGPSATTVNYQGRLANSGGSPLTGTYGMSFSLWDAASGGTLKWGPENHAAVPVSGGLFSVGLGSQTSGGIPTNVWDGDRYLQITVGGETLSPRELIRSVPIAGMALMVPDGAIGTAQIADGAVTRAKAPSLIASTTANTEIQYGRAYAQAAGTTGTLTVDIDFEPDFVTAPQVFLQPIFNHTASVIATWGSPCDRTICRVYLVRADHTNWENGQGQWVDWMALSPR